MLWLKAFHIFFVVSWFAGLFYLPRIFVNHAMAEEQAVRERLKLMEAQTVQVRHAHRRTGRHHRAVAVVRLCGLCSWRAGCMSRPRWWPGLVAYHLYCGHLVKVFAADRNTSSHVWFRFFNEVPVLVLLRCILVL